jgi:hypothetical protein
MGYNALVNSPTVVTATSLEWKAARRELPGWEVVRVGVALEHGHPEGETLIFCGLAGGLHEHLPTGAIVIPREVRRPDGTTMKCDEELVRALTEAARALGHEPADDPIVTSSELIVGAERARWSGEGYAAVDMETGLLSAPRVAAVRVVLDTPLRELSADWINPLAAMLKPWNWPQAMWLGREAPRCAALAAKVIAAARFSQRMPD